MKTLITVILFLFATPIFAQQKFTINFDYNKYDINANAKKKLDSFIQSSPVSSIQKINLYGHCDATGNNTYNDQLSIKRIDTVKQYLLANNIPQNVFDTLRGFGKRQPLNNNTNDEERSMNRRVEIIIERTQEQPAQEIKQEAPKPEQTLTEKIKDSTTKAGTNIILKNMNFIGGRHYLIPQSRPVLEELLQVMQQNPTLEIEIQGHICCVYSIPDALDSDTRTYDLSVQRAKAVYEYLISKGINKDRLSYKGFGHKYPLFEEDSPEHQALNRRVEIKIIKK